MLEDEEIVDFMIGLDIPTTKEDKLGFEDFEEWPPIFDTDNNVFGPGEDENELGPLFKNKTSHGDASGHNQKIKLLPTPSPSPERQEVDQRQDSIHNSYNNILTERGHEKPLPKGWVEFEKQKKTPVFGSKAGISADIDPSNIIEGKNERKKKMAQCLATNIQCPLFHTAFASSKNLVKPVGLHSSEFPLPPKNYKEMLKHEYSAGFKAAQLKEVKKLTEMKAIKFVRRDKLKNLVVESVDKPLPLMWVYAYKLDPAGYLVSFKARVVARGDLQSTEEDTYAATVAAYVTRSIAAIIGAHGLGALQYDAINAYGNSRRKIPLFTRCPSGFEHLGDGLLVFLGMYGLKPSALDWYNTYKSAAIEIGLSVVPDSPCMFQNSFLVLIVYVDDIIIAYHPQHEDQFREFDVKFLQIFEFRKLGNV
ncbi:hypothetical protein GcC1_100035 [Golovinomyces cichoracearum]|uniref:Reverse transcriptase Ty1/copia-type domain-containing protein n=1 Tax=Golovinomyces cichoracearum TaxID=62708 RepID=A0A420IA54_9PEZI|nr:hypothetical protein GcC1_100035 [Golovinomyces cichoracearum]